MVKNYAGVSENEIAEKRHDWIQKTRALPDYCPTFREIFSDLIAAIFIYDALFFLIHLLLHRNFRLYEWFHKDHHMHDRLHARVTHQLSVTERVGLVLTANFALKLVHAHPLTRIFYVPIFLWLLIENHAGYDLPWSVDKWIWMPRMGGARYHYQHHMKGSGNYQPFFTYFDTLYQFYMHRRSKRRIPLQ